MTTESDSWATSLKQRHRDEVAIAAAASSIEVHGIRIAPRVETAGPYRPILEHVSGPRLSEVATIDNPATEKLVYGAAAVLARLHRAEVPVVRPTQCEAPPWRAVPYSAYVSMTETQREIVGLLHRSQALRRCGKMTEETLIDGQVWCHGDARLDNFVLGDTPMLIDWECSGAGRPEIDISSLLASALALALTRALASSAAEVRKSVERALLDFRKLVTAAITGYRDSSGARIDNELLSRAVGSKLIVRAFARGGESSHDRIVAMLMSIGTSLVQHPGRARALLIL